MMNRHGYIWYIWVRKGERERENSCLGKVALLCFGLLAENVYYCSNLKIIKKAIGKIGNGVVKVVCDDGNWEKMEDQRYIS